MYADSQKSLAVDTRAGYRPDNRPEWKRRRGRPCRAWMQQIEEDSGLNVNDAWRIAHDRKSWRALRHVAGQAVQWVSEWVYMHAHGKRSSNQILHGNQTRWEENFYGVDRACCPGWKLLTQKLTHDLFVVANLLILIMLLHVLVFATDFQLIFFSHWFRISRPRSFFLCLQASFNFFISFLLCCRAWVTIFSVDFNWLILISNTRMISYTRMFS